MGALGRFCLREGHEETSSTLKSVWLQKRFVVAIGQAEGSVFIGTESSIFIGIRKPSAIRLCGTPLKQGEN